MKVITKLPNEEAKIAEIGSEIGELQGLVGGLIEIVDMPKKDGIEIVVNDNFLNEGMEPNIILPEREEVLCGPIVIAGLNKEEGSLTSLSEKELKEAMAYIERNKVYGMSLGGAYRYCRVAKEFQESEDEIKRNQMEVS